VRRWWLLLPLAAATWVLVREADIQARPGVDGC
jgi:hypothetical protein